MENKKNNLQKHGLIKNRNQQHKLLIGKYKENFDPLLLPKLAIIGYQIRPDPSSQIFISKLLLFDKNAIKKENKFISNMKKMLQVMWQKLGKTQSHTYEEFTQINYKQTALDIRFEEDRHTYNQLLTNRLNDLNQLIFHVQRNEKVPLLQKECRNLLELEISKIEKIKNSFALKNQCNKKQEDPTPKLFNMLSHKQDQTNKKKQIIKQLYERQQNLKKGSPKRIVTQPCQPVMANNQIKQVTKKNSIMKVLQEPVERCITQTTKQNRSSRFYDNVDNATNRINSRIHHVPGLDKYTTERVKFQSRNKSNLMNIKTEDSQNDQINNKNFKFGKSVRLNFQQSNKKVVTKQANYNNLKSVKTTRNRQTVLFKGDDANKIPRSKRSTKKNKTASAKSLKCSNDSSSKSSFSEIFQQNRDKKPKKQVRFNQNFQQVQRKNYIYKSQNLRGRNIKRDRLKMSMTVIPMCQDIPYERQRSKSNESKYSKQNSKKIIRREALVQQIDKNLKTIDRKKIGKIKRNGVKLNAQANKHLVRLLKESNIQDIMISNEFQEKSTLIKIKNRQGANTNPNKLKQSGKRIINKKNEILLQVDFQSAYKERDQKRYSQQNYYVKSHGFEVNSGDFGGLKEFVKVNPYQHQQIANFYGGEKIGQINFELITNEIGQYSFNRQFIYRMKKIEDEEQQYVPYKFPSIDPSDYLSIQISRQFIKNSNQIKQRPIHDSQILL